MQISVETTTQSTSILSASFSSGKNKAESGKSANEEGKETGAPVLSALEAATKKAEEDAVVIAALQAAVDKGKEEDAEEDDGEKALATIEDYQNTAGKIKSALGEDSRPSVTYESATISTTTIEAEIGDNTLTAQFVSFERVSYDNETGLSVRSADASTIEGRFGATSVSYQSASVSELYSGTGEQFSNFAGLVA